MYLTASYFVISPTSPHERKFLDYRYHFQDGNNQLIFRYDSTPHFPNLPNFPYHKHLSNDVISADKPDIALVIMEVKEILSLVDN